MSTTTKTEVTLITPRQASDALDAMAVRERVTCAHDPRAVLSMFIAQHSQTAQAPAAASGAGTQHDERAAFEAWCNEDDDLGTSRGYGAGTGEYDEHDTNYAWKAWQARAALAAAPAAAKSVSESRDIQNHMMVIACQAAQGEHASGKAMLRAVTKALAGDQNLMRKIIAKHAPAAAQAQPESTHAIVRAIDQQLQRAGLEPYSDVHRERRVMLLTIRHFLAVSAGHLPDWLLQPAQAMRDATEQAGIGTATGATGATGEQP